MATPKQTDPQFKLRLTPDLKHKIDKAAEASNRSMNAEIIARLEASFDTGFRQDMVASQEFEIGRLKAIVSETLGMAQNLQEVLKSLEGATQNLKE